MILNTVFNTKKSKKSGVFLFIWTKSKLLYNDINSNKISVFV